jgi:ribbon-helix-helix protein
VTTRWNLSIPDEVDRSVRSYLASRGLKKGDLSKFVTEAVSRQVLRRTLRDIRDSNTDLSEEEALELANEAIAWARADRP